MNRVAELQDQLFGTRGFTEGAKYQLPRKIPLRIEPKTYFALERTFLSWMHMAITLGGVTSALIGFTVSSDTDPSSAGNITRRTSELISLILLPVAILMVGYALFVFLMRSRFLEKKQYGFFDDKVGPVTLCVCIMMSLTFILFMSFYDYMSA